MLYSAVRFLGKSNLRNFEVEAYFFLEVRKKSRLHGRGGSSGFRAHCSAGNLVLQLRGPHLRIWPWWRRRSSMAVTAALSPSSFPQSSTGLLEVTRVLARS